MTTTAPPITLLDESARRRIAHALIIQVVDEGVDPRQAALMLIGLGLCGDETLIAHAADATVMSRELGDGTVRPKDVDSELRVHADLARDFLVDQYDHEVSEAVASLAQVRS